MSAEAVKVAVRVRPFNGREKEQNSHCIIKVHAAADRRRPGRPTRPPPRAPATPRR